MGGNINYHLNKGSGVDFLFSKDADKTLIGVCTEPDADHRMKVRKALKGTRGNKAIIITLNGKEVPGDPVYKIPLQKWLGKPFA